MVTTGTGRPFYTMPNKDIISNTSESCIDFAVFNNSILNPILSDYLDTMKYNTFLKVKNVERVLLSDFKAKYGDRILAGYEHYEMVLFFNFGWYLLIVSIGDAYDDESCSLNSGSLHIVSKAENWEKAKEDIFNKIREIKSTVETDNSVYLDWFCMTSRGLADTTLKIDCEEVVHNEAYPDIEDISKFIKEYEESKSSIILLTGIPGTGKTILARHIIKNFKFTNTNKKIAYTMDPDAILSEEFYIRMIADNYDLLLLEDIDQFLYSRESEENKVMSRLLSTSDGIIKRNLKIIITSNISIPNIDAALTREGRCFGKYEFRELTVEEGINLMEKVNPDIPSDSIEEEMTLAQIYAIAQGTRQKSNLGEDNNRYGFRV